MQVTDKGTAGELVGEGLRIGIVRARFNDSLTSKIAEACLSELERLDVDPGDVRVVTVPGAVSGLCAEALSRFGAQALWSRKPAAQHTIARAIVVAEGL